MEENHKGMKDNMSESMQNGIAAYRQVISYEEFKQMQKNNDYKKLAMVFCTLPKPRHEALQLTRIATVKVKGQKISKKA